MDFTIAAEHSHGVEPLKSDSFAYLHLF
jgi:hypothetical protein